jgi:uncharacterized protein YcaQ
MPLRPLKVEPEAARRFLRSVQLLDSPVSGVAEALGHLGYVQVDPINICGRMHDLILRNRVAGYREGGLHAHIHSGRRPGFEHYLPGSGILVALPMEAWAHVSEGARRRRTSANHYGGRLSAGEERLAKRILAEIAERGPLTSDDIDHEARATTNWGTGGRMAKIVLDKLFFHARVLISCRRGFRRVYDLPERVLPPAVLAAPPAPAELTARWTVVCRLRQRRLTTVRKAELRLVGDLVHPVEIEGCPPLWCLREDVPLLEASGEPPEVGARRAPLLLAPLDPVIYDRRLTLKLWDFDYTWEVYTPRARRKRGYYALPVLSGTEIVGHVDPKADREGRRLEVVSRRVRRGHPVAAAVRALAEFLGLRCE